MTTTFTDLGVNARVRDTLARRGVTEPFAVQTLVLEDAIAGRDVLARSATGSGKTLAFAIPIWLRWRHGDKFEVGTWNNGSKYKWMNPIAVAEIVIVSLYLMMPTTPAANPFRDEFEWKFVNYAPIVTLGALLLLVIWWNVSAKKWFTGPKHTIDQAVVEAFED